MGLSVISYNVLAGFRRTDETTRVKDVQRRIWGSLPHSPIANAIPVGHFPSVCLTRILQRVL